MPAFDITAPDGTHYEVTGPEGATEQQALQQVMAQHPQQASPQPQAAPQQNDEGIISGVGNMLRGAYHFPERVMQSAVEIGARGTDAVGLTNGAYAPIHKMFSEDNASAAGGSKYYGAGKVIGDVAGTIPLGALRLPGIASKLPMVPTLAKIGTGALQGATASAATSSESDAPLSAQMGLGAAIGAAIPGGAALLGAGKKALTGVVGETTGAGATSIRNAYAAGKEGGEASKAFTGSMRGDVPWGQVVTDAKQALGKLREQRGAAYRSGMVNIKNDATVLDFAPVDKAMADASKIKAFAGRSGTGPVQDLSPKTADARSEVETAINEWKKLDAAEYHTPEGFDALKQKIGDIRDHEKYGTPAWKVASDAYNAIRGTIAKQAPAYDKVMRDFSEASDELSSLERELSLGKKVNPNTALRKLQSVMRDNANTSWGQRSEMAQRLADAGAPNLMPALAGQALSTSIPRGLAKWGDAGLMAAAVAHNPLSILALPAASPRLVGEVAHGAGVVNRGATNLGQKIPFALPSLPSLIPTAGVLAPRLAYQQ